MVKGRGNYLCRAQLETVESRIELWDVDGWQRLLSHLGENGDLPRRGR